MPAAVPLLLALASAAPLEVALAPTAARPGDAVLVRVTGAGETAPRGTLAGRALAFWHAGPEWRALAPLAVEVAPGTAAVVVEAAGARVEVPLAVVDPAFRATTLTVAPRFVEPPPSARARIAADRKAFARAWEQPFGPPLFDGFAPPRDMSTSGRFGDQRILNGHKESAHYGVDLRGPRGSPVHASADGRVALARDAYMSGKTVVLWHGAGVFTVYFHMDRLDVRTGDRVVKGQRLGLLGSTGRSTGPHLHWGAKVGGLYVDPVSLLDIDFASGTAPPRTTPGPAAPEPEAAPPAAPEAGAPGAVSGAPPAPPR